MRISGNDNWAWVTYNMILKLCQLNKKLEIVLINVSNSPGRSTLALTPVPRSPSSASSINASDSVLAQLTGQLWQEWAVKPNAGGHTVCPLLI